MKKLNKNIFLFVFAFIFIFLGFGSRFWYTAKEMAAKMLNDIKSGYVIGAIVDLTAGLEGEAAKSLAYHDVLMEINAEKSKLLNNRIIEKEGMTIVKTDTGHLIELHPYVSDEAIDEVVAAIDLLYNSTKESGAEFLYVGVANKGYDSSIPSNVETYAKSNYDRFIAAMCQNNIPCLNLTEELIKENLWSEDVYFATDHHWKPNIGFWANRKICETLGEKYGFEYNEKFTDLQNYNVKTYENWFLGSYGKKTGRLFVSGGADDIDIITPDFDTDLTAIQPFKDQITSGGFYDVVMEKRFIETKDYYNLNAYAAYTGGDFELQIIKNNLNPDGDKIIVIRDSFACCVTPYLSLNAGELHVMDLRDFTNVSGETINVCDYIEKEKPDHVIVLYQGISSMEWSKGKYQFDYSASSD